MSNLSKHAIITGGSSGIGKAIALKLASLGYNISLIARDPHKLQQAVKDISTACNVPDQSIISFSADVSDAKAIYQAMSEAIKSQGTPDLLITCAGMSHPDYFENLDVDVFEKSMAINYFGTLYAIKAALPSMKQNKSGQIILISSMAGLIGLFGYTAYSPTKFAVRGLAEALRPELKPFGIQVSIVYPPDTETPQLTQENLTKPEEAKQINATVKAWSPEKVSEYIVRGITKKQFHITLGISGTALQH